MVYAFIDSQNLHRGIRELGWELDFARFRAYLRDKYGVAKAFLFIGWVDGHEGLYESLQGAGYELVFKPTVSFGRGEQRVTKGNVDAELILRAIVELPAYDQAVVISGDGDYACLLEHLEGQGKLGSVIVPNRRRYSALLRRFHRRLVFLDGLQAKLGRRTKNERE